MDLMSSVKELSDIVKFIVPLVGSVWYLSHRLTSIDGKLKDNSNTSIARDLNNLQALELAKSALVDQIHCMDSKVVNIDTRISGELKELNAKSSSHLEASESEFEMKLTIANDKISLLVDKIDKYSESIHSLVVALEKRVCIAEQKISEISNAANITAKPRLRKKVANQVK